MGKTKHIMLKNYSFLLNVNNEIIRFNFIDPEDAQKERNVDKQ